MKKMIDMLSAFGREEDGIALTEYLILLGLLASGAIAAVLSIGDDLGLAWGTWETWFGAADLDAPT